MRGDARAEPVDQEDLASPYRWWKTADLVRATTAEASTYTPEALAALRHELERRDTVPEAFQDTLGSLEGQLRGVRGLLALMLFAIGFESVYLLLDVIRDFQRYSFVTAVIAGLIKGGLGLFGLFSCRQLLRIDPRAPRVATAWFILVMAVGVVSLSILLLAGKAPPASTLVVRVEPVLWLLYLQVSKRVKITYGSSGRQQIAETTAGFE
jgi:hypothetical protein